MALARIITRSHACSRELALDLLARGYAVEIVSPDSIPDNIADLELRVDTAPGDQLIASVEAHDGERSASLEFLHQLKAPMVDFIRRPLEPSELGQAVHFPEQPVSFNAEPSIEDVELPAEKQLAAKIVSSAAKIPLDPELDPRFDIEEGARLISPLDPLPSLPVEPPSHFAAEASTIARPLAEPVAHPAMVRPVRESQQRGRSAGWFSRAALIFASVVLLALVVGFGMRRAGKASAPSSGAVPAEKVAAASTAKASTDVDMLSAADPGKDPGKDLGKISVVAVSPPAMKSEGNTGRVPKESPVAKTAATGTSTASTGTGISRRHGDDLIARDTVTYFDKPNPKAEPTKRFADRHPSSRKHDGVVAANTVTYLNNKPAPKAAKPDSGVKHYSDLN
ncbi:MAG: hypothetical protein ABSA54_14760 [Terriglobales bacterium]|jgi:hypothetical protein